MTDLTNEIIVVDIAGNEAIVRCGSNGRQAQLAELGFRAENQDLRLPIASVDELRQLIVGLIGLDALFSCRLGARLRSE